MGFLRQNILPIVLALAGIALIVFGVYQVTSSQKKEKVEFQPASAEAKPTPAKIMVDIEGAVIKPGVYSLNPEARFVDALAAAGGMSDDADREYVSKNINLAKAVTDGLKIYVPRVGEEILAASEGSSSESSSTININTAGAADLDKLPGIGSVTADKIINGRPYQNIEELLKKKIVSQSVFDKIKNMISAN